MKKNKSKKMVWIVSLLTCVGIGTLGFASFILGGVTSATEQVTINVGDVVDNAVVTKISENPDLNISFDFKNNGLNESITNGDNKTEDLEFSFTFTISANKSLTELLQNVTIKFTANDDLLSYSNGNYVNLPFTNLSENSITIETKETTISGTNNAKTIAKSTLNSNNMTLSCEVTSTFEWGSEFDNKNPCDYTATGWENKLRTFGNLKSQHSNPKIEVLIQPNLKA